MFTTKVGPFSEHDMTKLWSVGLDPVKNFRDLKHLLIDLRKVAGALSLYITPAAPSDASLASTLTSTLNCVLVEQILFMSAVPSRP